jgi:antitoxin component YwqK of YwqJK toxin-antitoxin module
MAQDPQLCYICYDPNSNENPFALSPPPCTCTGSIAIHIKCLNKVIKKSRICSICKTKYNLAYLPQKHGLELITEPLDYGRKIEYTVNKNGEKHGMCITYNNTNQIISKYSYISGELDGPFIEYYWNGNMKCLGEYKDGRQNGDYSEWYEDGTLQEESMYVDGVKHGLCTYYMKDGYVSVSNMVNYINGEAHDIYTNSDSYINIYRDTHFN